MDKKRLKKITLLQNKGYFYKYMDKKDNKTKYFYVTKTIFIHLWTKIKNKNKYNIPSSLFTIFSLLHLIHTFVK